MRLEATNIHAGYGDTPVLRDVDFHVTRGEIVSILGANGSGKSTLLKVLAGILKPSSGDVRLDTRPVADIPSRQLARHLALLPQDQATRPEMTVRQLVGYGRFPHVGWLRQPGSGDRAAVDRALERCGLSSMAERMVGTLSGGERQRAWIAMAMAQEPVFMLLDEPITFLDIRYQAEIMELVRQLNREEGTGIVMVLHDINLALRFSHRVGVMDRGSVLADASPDAIVQGSSLEEAFAMTSHVIPNPITGEPYCLFEIPEGQRA